MHNIYLESWNKCYAKARCSKASKVYMAKRKCIAIGGISNECNIYSPLFQAGTDFEKIHEHIQEQNCRFIGRHHKRTLAPLRTRNDSLTLSVTVSPSISICLRQRTIQYIFIKFWILMRFTPTWWCDHMSNTLFGLVADNTSSMLIS